MANITTKDDYKMLFGIDLDAELGNPNDTGDKNSTILIRRVEDFIKAYYSEPNYRWDGEVKSDHQKKCFRLAVCYQIEYVINSGTLNHSGFDVDTGIKITRDDLEKLKVSGDAHYFMRKGGMANL